MTYQSELIDSLKGRLGLVSDYAIAQRWKVEPTRISQYRRGRLRLPLNFVIDIAEQTGNDPLILLRFLEIKRAKNPTEVSTWKPNEKVRRYCKPWVKKQHWFKKR